MTGRKNKKQFFVENGLRFQIIKVRVGSLLKKTLGWSSDQRAIEFMGRGYSVTALAGHLGISKDAIYDWINLYPDFRHAINMGRAARVAALETKLLSTSQGVGVTAAIFALKNADPDEWQDRYYTETKVNVSIDQMSDADLLAIIAKADTPALIEAKPVEAATDANGTGRRAAALVTK